MTVEMIDLLSRCDFSIDELRELVDFSEYVMRGLVEMYCQRKLVG